MASRSWVTKLREIDQSKAWWVADAVQTRKRQAGSTWKQRIHVASWSRRDESLSDFYWTLIDSLGSNSPPRLSEQPSFQWPMHRLVLEVDPWIQCTNEIPATQEGANKVMSQYLDAVGQFYEHLVRAVKRMVVAPSEDYLCIVLAWRRARIVDLDTKKYVRFGIHFVFPDILLPSDTTLRKQLCTYVASYFQKEGRTFHWPYQERHSLFDTDQFELAQLHMPFQPGQNDELDAVYTPVMECKSGGGERNRAHVSKWYGGDTPRTDVENWLNKTTLPLHRRRLCELSVFPNEAQMNAWYSSVTRTNAPVPHVSLASEVMWHGYRDRAFAGGRVSCFYNVHLLRQLLHEQLQWKESVVRVRILFAHWVCAVLCVQFQDHTTKYYRVRVHQTTSGVEEKPHSKQQIGISVYEWHRDLGRERYCLSLCAHPSITIDDLFKYDRGGVHEMDFEGAPAFRMQPREHLLRYKEHTDMLNTPGSLLVSRTGGVYRWESSATHEGMLEAKPVKTSTYNPTIASAVSLAAKKSGLRLGKAEYPRPTVVEYNDLCDPERADKKCKSPKQVIEELKAREIWKVGALVLLILTAQCGAGKTHFVAQLPNVDDFSDDSFAYASATRKVVGTLHKEVRRAAQNAEDVGMYDPRNDDEEACRTKGLRQLLCSCTPSLSKYLQHKVRNWLILDEIGQFVQSLFASYQDRWRQTMLMSLCNLIVQQAFKGLVLMDADFDPFCSVFVPLFWLFTVVRQQKLPALRNIQIIHVKNCEFDVVREQKRTLVITPYEHELFECMVDELREGNRIALFTVTQSKLSARLEQLLHACKNSDNPIEYPRILVVESEKHKDKWRAEYWPRDKVFYAAALDDEARVEDPSAALTLEQHILKYNIQALVYTGAMSHGESINLSQHPFHHVFAFLDAQPDAIAVTAHTLRNMYSLPDLRAMRQSLERVRRFTRSTVHIPPYLFYRNSVGRALKNVDYEDDWSIQTIMDEIERQANRNVCRQPSDDNLEAGASFYPAHLFPADAHLHGRFRLRQNSEVVVAQLRAYCERLATNRAFTDLFVNIMCANSYTVLRHDESDEVREQRLQNEADFKQVYEQGILQSTVVPRGLRCVKNQLTCSARGMNDDDMGILHFYGLVTPGPQNVHPRRFVTLLQSAHEVTMPVLHMLAYMWTILDTGGSFGQYRIKLASSLKVHDRHEGKEYGLGSLYWWHVDAHMQGEYRAMYVAESLLWWLRLFHIPHGLFLGDWTHARGTSKLIAQAQLLDIPYFPPHIGSTSAEGTLQTGWQFIRNTLVSELTGAREQSKQWRRSALLPATMEAIDEKMHCLKSNLPELGHNLLTIFTKLTKVWLPGVPITSKEKSNSYVAYNCPELRRHMEIFNCWLHHGDGRHRRVLEDGAPSAIKDWLREESRVQAHMHATDAKYANSKSWSHQDLVRELLKPSDLDSSRTIQLKERVHKKRQQTETANKSE